MPPEYHIQLSCIFWEHLILVGPSQYNEFCSQRAAREAGRSEAENLDGVRPACYTARCEGGASYRLSDPGAALAIYFQQAGRARSRSADGCSSKDRYKPCQKLCHCHGHWLYGVSGWIFFRVTELQRRCSVRTEIPILFAISVIGTFMKRA